MDRRRLDAWKEIASYLGRDVTTVRRWEKREGLPVHRHLHRKLGSVYAYTDEIDAWWLRRSTELSEAVPAPEPAPPASPLPAASVRQLPSPNGAAGFAISAAVLTLVLLMVTMINSHVWMPRPSIPNPGVYNVALTPPEGTLVDSLALSPDGRDVVFAASDSTGSHLWTRRVASTVARRLEGTDGAAFPFWAPDGRSVGFFANGRLKRISVFTREVTDLAAAPNGRGGSWSDLDEIVYAPDDGSPLFRIAASGGPPTAVTKLGREVVEGHAWPDFLPGGTQLVYTDYVSDRDRHGVYLLDLESGGKWRVVPSYTSAVYMTTGHLLYVNRDGDLVAQRFNEATHTPFGLPALVVNRVVYRYGIGHRVDIAVSRTGIIASRSADEVQTRLAVVDRASGRVVRTIGPPAFYANPTFSRDGRQLIVSVAESPTQEFNLWRYDFASGDGARLSVDSGGDIMPVWSSDGQRLIFTSGRWRERALHERNLKDGSEARILPALRMLLPDSWSTDDRYLALQALNQGTKFDVMVWDFTETRLFPVAATGANEGHGQISPDGRFVAYTSDESGRFEVYVKAFPSGTDRWPVSSRGGVEPRWSRNGRELVYIAADRKLMAVSVTTTPSFQRGMATPLFDSQAQYLWQDTRNHYDLTPDGRQFVVMLPASDQRTAPYTLTVNWR